MNKNQLKKVVRERAKLRVNKEEHLTAEVVSAIVDLVFETIEETVLKGETVSIYEFGKFCLQPVGRKIARNPKTGEIFELPPRKKFTFKPSRRIKFVEE